MSRTLSRVSPGFTLVELQVVLLVLGIVTTIVMVTLANFYSSNIQTLGRTAQANDTTSALTTIEKNLSLSSSFLAKSPSLSAPYGPTSGTSQWSFRGDNAIPPASPPAASSVLIAQTYATGTDGKLVYQTGPTGCDPTLGPAKNTLIYFVKSSILFRRTIVPTGTCGGAPVAQKQTCESTKLNTGMPQCLTSDAVLLADVSHFWVDYFAQAANATPSPVYAMSPESAATPVIDTVKSIGVTIESTRSTAGTTNKHKASIRINAFSS